MMTAKIFMNGRSQAVRLPKECRFDCEEVAVTKVGDVVMLIPGKKERWQNLLESINEFSDDFMEEEYQKILKGEQRD